MTVGQPISVVAEVLVPAYFMGAPQFPELDLSDALVLFEPRGGELHRARRRRDLRGTKPPLYDLPAAGVATFREFAEGASDPELVHEARALGATLYAEPERADGNPWFGRALYRRVTAARRTHARAVAADDELPPLNPA